MQLTLSTWGIENWGYMRRADHGDVGASNTEPVQDCDCWGTQKLCLKFNA